MEERQILLLLDELDRKVQPPAPLWEIWWVDADLEEGEFSWLVYSDDILSLKVREKLKSLLRPGERIVVGRTKTVLTPSWHREDEVMLVIDPLEER